MALIPVLALLIAAASPCAVSYAEYQDTVEAFTYNCMQIPAYDGDPSEIVNGNVPTFTDGEIAEAKDQSYETYSELDELGRCGVCEASLDYGLMPDYERGSISSITPSGWVQASYDIIPGKWLYNRCHLIGFQLTGVDTANKKKEYAKLDLVTGTKYLNVGEGATGMVEYENKVAKYIKEHNGAGSGSDAAHRVLYRVTPVFDEDDLVCLGVLMEGKSVESDEIKFNVFCYNVQPGISIDYATGKSMLSALTPDPVDIGKLSASLSKTKYVYSGRALKPKVTIKDGGTTLKEGVDYSLTYEDNKYVGSASALIKGLGNYSGEKTLTYKIVPKTPSIASVTPGKKALRVKWRRVLTENAGYQIEYARNRSFTKSKKRITHISYKVSTRKITRLARKKKYYIRMRSYKKVAGSTYYGNWCTVKAAKTK